MRALLIEFDLRTGKRAGDINPRDPKLLCHGWQNLDSNPALEIRLVNDDRDLSRYQGIKGVTVLDGKDEINAAIKANLPTRYEVSDIGLMLEHAKQKNISLDTLAGKSKKEIAQELFTKGIAGIIKKEPILLRD